MRLLLLDTSKEFRGGQQQLCYLAEGFVASGVDFLVGVRPGWQLEEHLRKLRAPLLGLNPLFEGSPAAAIRFAREMTRQKIDLVNAQSSHDHTLAWFASALMKHPPLRVVTRRVDFAPGAGRFNRKKYMTGADHYIAISSAIRDVLTGYGLPGSRVHLIPSCVPGVERVAGAKEKLQSELGLPQDVYFIGDVASLVGHKGHEYLLSALPKVLAADPRVHVLLAGHGPLRDSLARFATEIGVDRNVHFLGWRQDVARVLSALDIFVMTSHLEGLNTSILDAMSVGVPVVATRAGGIPEIVRDGQTGWLAQNKNPDSIAAVLLAAKNNPRKAAELAENARLMVREEFAVKTMVKRTAELFQRLFEEKPQS